MSFSIIKTTLGQLCSELNDNKNSKTFPVVVYIDKGDYAIIIDLNFEINDSWIKVDYFFNGDFKTVVLRCFHKVERYVFNSHLPEPCPFPVDVNNL